MSKFIIEDNLLGHCSETLLHKLGKGSEGKTGKLNQIRFKPIAEIADVNFLHRQDLKWQVFAKLLNKKDFILPFIDLS